ncbi:MAG: phage holin family protein [Cyclobacteriaceae bacterium]|nr:phage holin family protein [Cyclobacteriaceae bacterium]
MSWTGKFIKTLAIAVIPVKLFDKGIAYAKKEVKEEFDKVKILLALGGTLFMILIFASVTIALVINYFTGNGFLGFIILTSVYLLAAIILYIVYRKNQNQK